MSSTGKLITDIEHREGDAQVTNDPADSGGRTKFGISERAHPEAWADGDVTEAEARDIYAHDYVRPFRGIPEGALLHQLVDLGVTSGPDTSIKVLQHTLGVTADGIIGPKTLAAIAAYPAGSLFGTPVPGEVMLNLAIRDARTMFYIAITKRFPKNLRFIAGWVKRTFEFK